MRLTASRWIKAPRRPRRVLEPLRQHADHGRRNRCGQGRDTTGAAHKCVQLVLVPFACGDLGHDLLREHVERLLGNRQTVELAAGDGIEQRRALDEVITRQREQPSLRRAVDRVPRAPDPLQEARDGTRRAELADQIDLADVDAELERGGRDQRLQRTALQTLLGIQPLLLGEAAVVRGTWRSPRRSDNARVTRSAIRRVLTKIRVVRCASISSARRS